jgi:hypothetical protein
MKRPVLVLILAAAGLRADFTPSAWQQRKRVTVDAARPAVAVLLTNDVYAGAQPAFDDLRVVRGTEEIPSMLMTYSGFVRESELEVEKNSTAVNSQGLEFRIELRSGGRHNWAQLALNRVEPGAEVRVETSPDGANWKVRAERTPLRIFHRDTGRHAAVEYPETIERFLRITMLGWKDATGASARVMYRQSQEPAWELVRAWPTPVAAAAERKGEALYQLDLQGAAAPVHSISVDVAAPELFNRAIRVEAQENQYWRTLGSGSVYRLAAGQSLAIRLSEPGRHAVLRLVVENGDNPPLVIRGVRAETFERRLIFPASSAGEYWIYFANANAKRAAYDLPMVLAKSSIDAAPDVAAAPAEKNPGYQPPPEKPKPWTERHPELLYTVLGAVVLVLGVLTIRFLKQSAAAPPGPN